MFRMLYDFQQILTLDNHSYAFSGSKIIIDSIRKWYKIFQMMLFFFFQKVLLFWGTCILSASERFLVLGRFWALGPPITVLTQIWNGLISRPKSEKTNQVCRHSLAAKTPTMKRRYFWKRAKIYPKQQKNMLFQLRAIISHNQKFQEYILYLYTYIYHAGIQWYTMKCDMFTTSQCSSTKKIRWVRTVYQSNKSSIYYID